MPKKERNGSKVKNISAILLLTAVIATGCGMIGNDSYRGESIGTDSIAAKMTTNTAESAMMMDDSFYTGGDYSGTSINGDMVGYSYDFRAAGKTKKTKEDMLSYYEELEKLVNGNDGYIESVNNSYNSYVIMDDDTYISESEIENKAAGYLSFTVQIPNDKITKVTDSLEKFCRENRFAVTTYNQTITNYKDVKVAEDGDDDTIYYGNTITPEELEKRTKYASMYVNISYYIPRGGFEKMGLKIKRGWKSFISAAGDILVIIVVVVITIFVLFIEAIILYKIWKRMVAKHRKKKPELYPPKKVIVEQAADTDKKKITE